jgi:hypothetical protein
VPRTICTGVSPSSVVFSSFTLLLRKCIKHWFTVSRCNQV